MDTGGHAEGSLHDLDDGARQNCFSIIDDQQHPRGCRMRLRSQPLRERVPEGEFIGLQEPAGAASEDG
jgi:hypothetical protein